MEIFFKQLILKLEKINSSWRSRYIFLLDGARYHRSKDFMEFAKKYRLPIMILGPYSFDAAPCELFFSHFKRTHHNPENFEMNKR